MSVLIVVLYNSNVTKMAQRTCNRAGPSTRALFEGRQATDFDKKTMKDNSYDRSETSGTKQHLSVFIA